MIVYHAALHVACVCGLQAIVISTLAAATGVGNAEQASRRVIVIAHRGVHDQAPENSIPAIRRAAEMGCDYVEVDVRTSRDKQLVLMHDATVDRTTNGSGEIAQLTLAEIRKVRFGPEWHGESVPTFDEALAECKGKIKVYIDHKEASPTDVLAAVERHGMLADVVVYGPVDELRQYKKLNPAVWIMPPHPGSVAAIRELAADLKPETLDGNIEEWTNEQAVAAHEVGAQIWVDFPENYNNEAGVKRAVDLNVDAIQTDRPELLIQLLEARNLR